MSGINRIECGLCIYLQFFFCHTLFFLVLKIFWSFLSHCLLCQQFFFFYCAFIKALAVCVGFRTVSVCVNDRDNMLYRVINDASSKPRRIQIIPQLSPLSIDQSQIAAQLDIHYS